MARTWAKICAAVGLKWLLPFCFASGAHEQSTKCAAVAIAVTTDASSMHRTSVWISAQENKNSKGKPARSSICSVSYQVQQQKNGSVRSMQVSTYYKQVHTRNMATWRGISFYEAWKITGESLSSALSVLVSRWNWMEINIHLVRVSLGHASESYFQRNK